MFSSETADHAYAMEEAAERQYHDGQDEVDPEDEDDEEDFDDEDDEEDWEDYDEEMAHRAWQEELFFPEPEDMWA